MIPGSTPAAAQGDAAGEVGHADPAGEPTVLRRRPLRTGRATAPGTGTRRRPAPL